MHWPPDIADDIPAPRDDEPASLRQDIADELADHLQCAFTRELHLTRDEQAAQEKALDRFGDPRAIARKLWFDALKETIMSQRLTLAFTSITALTCLAATALAWNALREGREINAAILERLEGLKPESPEIVAPAAWGSVRVRAVLDGPDGAPAIGHRLVLSGSIYNTAGSAEPGNYVGGSLTETVGKSGDVDFGTLHAGPYSLHVTTPWGEHTSRNVSILPGRKSTIDVVCPGKPPEQGTVRVTASWPDELRDRNYLLRVSFAAHRKVSGDDKWASDIPQAVLIDTKNAFAIDARSKEEERFVRFPGSLKFLPELKLTEGEYVVTAFEIYQPTNSEKLKHLMVKGRFPASMAHDAVFDQNGHDSNGGFMGGGGGGFFDVDELQIGDTVLVDITDVPPPTFSVLANQMNPWEIQLPDEVIEPLTKFARSKAAAETPQN
jgi:hypothetical protein